MPRKRRAILQEIDANADHVPTLKKSKPSGEEDDKTLVSRILGTDPDVPGLINECRTLTMMLVSYYRHQKAIVYPQTTTERSLTVYMTTHGSASAGRG